MKPESSLSPADPLKPPQETADPSSTPLAEQFEAPAAGSIEVESAGVAADPLKPPQ